MKTKACAKKGCKRRAIKWGKLCSEHSSDGEIRRAPKRGTVPGSGVQTAQLLIRISPMLIQRIDDHLEWLKKHRPGNAGTRSSVIRQLLQTGIEATEKADYAWLKTNAGE